MGAKSRAGSTPVLGMFWATSSAGLEHLVYTERVTGSNPVSPIECLELDIEKDPEEQLKDVIIYRIDSSNITKVIR